MLNIHETVIAKVRERDTLIQLQDAVTNGYRVSLSRLDFEAKHTRQKMAKGVNVVAYMGCSPLCEAFVTGVKSATFTEDNKHAVVMKINSAGDLVFALSHVRAEGGFVVVEGLSSGDNCEVTSALVEGRRIRNTAYTQGINTLVVENGYFRKLNNDSYYQTSWNRIGRLCDANTYDTVVRNERPCVQVYDLEVESGCENTILIMGQKPLDAQHELTRLEMLLWIAHTAALYIEQGYRVKVRPHPNTQDPKMFERDLENIMHFLVNPLQFKHQFLVVHYNMESLSLALSRCILAVALNSTSLLECVQHGVPVVCHPTSHVARYYMSEGTQAQPTVPVPDDMVYIGYHADRAIRDSQRQRLMSMVCASQWSKSEMRLGSPLHFLISQVT